MALEPKAIGDAVRRRREELRWSQERLAEETGASQSTIDRVEKGQFKRMPSDLPMIATAMDLRIPGLNLERLVGGSRPPPPFLGESDLRVFSAAEGGPGEMVVSTDPIEVVPRPWYLKSVKDAFAVLVTGESMVPAFRPGDYAIVNPRLPPVRDRDIILVTDESEGEFRASIKRLMRWTDKEWHLMQFNPPTGQKPEFTLSRRAWPKVLRVVGKYDGG